MSWQNYPLIRLIIPFVLGMIGADLLIEHMNGIVLFVLCCIFLSVLFFFLRKAKDTCQDRRFGIVAMGFVCLVGMALYTGKYQRVERGVPQNTSFCSGTLTEHPQERERSWVLNLRQENGTHLLLYIGKNVGSPSADSVVFAGLHVGDTILAPVEHLHATSEAMGEGLRSYGKVLFYKGVCATAYTPCDQWSVHPRQGFDWFVFLRNLQREMRHTYNDYGISGEAGGVVEAMTIGDKTHVSEALRVQYAASGVAHLLAMSGFHVCAIVMLLQCVLFKGLLPHAWVWLCHVLIILVLWGFAVVAGLSPSIVRATLMFTILLCCQAFGHELLSLNSCALALLVMLCINPLYLQNVGFQLSFVAVAGIGMMGQPLFGLSPTATPMLRFLWSLIAMSLVCSVATAPLVAYHFGRLPVLSVFSNVLTTPFVYLILWGSILWWAFLWCDAVSEVLAAVLNWAAGSMNVMTERIAALPFSSIEWHPSPLMTVFCYGALLTIVYMTSKLRRT